MNIIKFSDFDPVKYSSTRVVVAIMEWLRYYTINDREVTVTSPVDKFLSETRLDRAQFLTFVSEMDKHGKEYGFSVEVDGDTVTFSELKNTGKKMIFESNGTGKKIVAYHFSNDLEHMEESEFDIELSSDDSMFGKAVYFAQSHDIDGRLFGKYVCKFSLVLEEPCLNMNKRVTREEVVDIVGKLSELSGKEFDIDYDNVIQYGDIFYEINESTTWDYTKYYSELIQSLGYKSFKYYCNSKTDFINSKGDYGLCYGVYNTDSIKYIDGPY